MLLSGIAQEKRNLGNNLESKLQPLGCERYYCHMPKTDSQIDSAFDYSKVRSRAKILLRQDQNMKAELIELRQKAGLTQLQIAEIIGVSQQAIQKLERYDSDPKMSTLRRYANAVGAIVSHKVDKDIGQSIWMAAEPGWAGLIKFTFPENVQTEECSVSNVSTTDWSKASQINFSLIS